MIQDQKASNGRRRWVLIFAAGVLMTAGAAAAWRIQAADRNESARIAEQLQIEPGMIVADVGAGDGEWAQDLAKRVGPSSRVYATEVTDSHVETLTRNTKGEGNIVVVKGDQEHTGLPEKCCARILLRLVYHHFDDPPAMKADLLRSLAPDGQIGVIEFPPGTEESSSPVAIRKGHGVRQEQLIKEMTEGGFEVVRKVDKWDGKNRYFVLFKPARR